MEEEDFLIHHFFQRFLPDHFFSIKLQYSLLKSKNIPFQASLSPALETSLEYHLKILSHAINYAGPALLSYKEELKDAIASAFEAPSWKVVTINF